ncbi:hypothetical protein CDAR_513031 [Caerostris darwini]|uniref:Uncharacterized protein n=1 Tax=Caerostris darwini TaxID=1538125 RepID=A0AAV4RZN2_9ARAC|nr:hypothetical protein CDAR_513031 [Caerostris darwini]
MSSGVGNLRVPAKAGQPSCYRSEALDLFVRGDLKTHFWRRLAVNDLLTSPRFLFLCRNHTCSFNLTVPRTVYRGKRTRHYLNFLGLTRIPGGIHRILL